MCVKHLHDLAQVQVYDLVNMTANPSPMFNITRSVIANFSPNYIFVDQEKIGRGLLLILLIIIKETTVSLKREYIIKLVM